MEAPPNTACLIVIGNEILSGRTQDTNLNWLAKELGKLGIRLLECRVIPDIPDVIVETVTACRARYSYVFTTGGIGPTHDDITAENIARAFGVKLVRHPEALRRLEKHYENPSDLTPARLKMADVPEGASLIDNPVSAAPGFKIGNVHVMAGVPRIMQAMFDSFKGTLAGGPPIISQSVSVYLTEGIIAEGLTHIQSANPDVEIGSYPFVRLARLGTSLVTRGTDAAAVERVTSELKAFLLSLNGEVVQE